MTQNKDMHAVIDELKRLDKERTVGSAVISEHGYGDLFMKAPHLKWEPIIAEFLTIPEYKANAAFIHLLFNNALPIITALQEQIAKLEKVIEQKDEASPGTPVND